MRTLPAITTILAVACLAACGGTDDTDETRGCSASSERPSATQRAGKSTSAAASAAESLVRSGSMPRDAAVEAPAPQPERGSEPETASGVS